MKAYPYLVKHNESKKHHVIIQRRSAGKLRETSFCGHLEATLNAHETSKTIPDAFKEKSLCKICLMSDEVVDIIADEFHQTHL